MLRRIAEVKAGDPLARVLVVVPTSRLASHVQRRLAGRFEAALGIEVLQYRALARSILEDAGRDVPAVADERLLGRLLGGTLAGLRRNPLAGLVRERPGAARGLLRTLADLREAGIAPDDLVAAGAATTSLAEIARAYARALASGRDRGVADDAVLMREATPFGEAFARRRRLVIHHGAYELIGIHLDLLRALGRGCEITILLPIAEGRPATAYAEAFARRFLLPPGGAFQPASSTEGGLLGDRLGALYDEAAAPSTLADGAVSWFHAQGAISETETASRLALRFAAELDDPGDVAIVARSLAPYGAALDLALREPELFDVATTRPLRAHPEVRDLLLALRAAVEEFPRAATAEALASPLLLWDDAPGFPGTAAESWSREAAITSTLPVWRERLISWASESRRLDDASDDDLASERLRAARRLASARRIVEALETFAREVDAGTPRPWSAIARDLSDLARRRLAAEAESEAVVERLLETIRGLARFETMLGEDHRVPFAEALSALEADLDAQESPVRAERGGVRLLDAMQARALTFERVIVMGLHAGLFPQTPREDPFLGDEARAALRETTGRPLAVKRDAESEERQLLVSMTGGARVGLHFAWQRADDRGGTTAPSLALREIARIALGEADLGRVRATARSVPAHPLRRLEALASWSGLPSPDEVVVLAALASDGGEAAAERIAASEPALRPGLALLTATESFAPRTLDYDGRVAAGALPPSGFSATQLAALGRCPLQYFFRYVLGIRPLEDETSPFEAEARRVGLAVHALLEGLYRRLRDDGAFEGGSTTLVARARALFPEAWLEATSTLAHSPLTVLREAHDARWRTAVEAFVVDDLARIVAAGCRPSALERAARASLPLRAAPLDVHGRFDRILSGPGGSIVGDYKTAGTLDKHTAVLEMLRGQSLQVPLYREIAERLPDVSGPVIAEVLGAGPEHEADRATFEGFETDALREGFFETLGILRDLAATGTFPMHVEPQGVCSRCRFAPACRRHHVPSQQRNALAADGADYRGALGKTRKTPRLADRRAAAPPESPP